LPSGQVDLNHFCRDLPETENIQHPAIRRPACGCLIRLCGGDQSGFATRDGVKIDLVVRANAGDQVALGGRARD